MLTNPETEPGLAIWLLEAAKAIEIVPGGDTWDGPHQVLVTNGLDGAGRTGAQIAVCSTAQDAELVAAGLWALVERHATRP